MFRRLFHNNRPPTDDARRLEDKHGKVYWAVKVDLGERVDFDVWRKGRRVGDIKTLQKADGGLTLADIIIHDKNLRGRGLGKAMLQLVIEYARGIGATYIWGFTPPDDPNEEYLKQWYLHHGFEVEHVGNTYHVTLKLEG